MYMKKLTYEPLCYQGTDIPEPCRNGTYGNSPNLKAESECRPCDPGYYCNATGAIAVTGPCDPGWSDSRSRFFNNLVFIVST